MSAPAAALASAWVLTSVRLPDAYRDVPIRRADGSERVGRLNRVGCWELAYYQRCRDQYMAGDVVAWFDTPPCTITDSAAPRAAAPVASQLTAKPASGGTATYKCKCCGDPFTARVADRKRGWAKFCSKSCKAKKQEARTGQHRAYQEWREGDVNELCFPSPEDTDVQP